MPAGSPGDGDQDYGYLVSGTNTMPHPRSHYRWHPYYHQIEGGDLQGNPAVISGTPAPPPAWEFEHSGWPTTPPVRFRWHPFFLGHESHVNVVDSILPAIVPDGIAAQPVPDRPRPQRHVREGGNSQVSAQWFIPGTLPAGAPWDSQGQPRPRHLSPVNAGGTVLRPEPFEDAPPILMPTTGEELATFARDQRRGNQGRSILDSVSAWTPSNLLDVISQAQFQSQTPDRPLPIRFRDGPHTEASLDYRLVDVSPIVWDTPGQIPRRERERKRTENETLPSAAALVSDAVIHLDWFDRTSIPARAPGRVPAHQPSPAVVPVPDAQESLTGGSLFPQPAHVTRQPVERRDQPRTWDQPPIVEADPLAFMHQADQVPVGQRRAVVWQEASRTEALVTLPFPLLEQQTPTIYPWWQPKPAAQSIGWEAEVNPQSDGLLLITVRGPYFTVAADIYCAGAIEGDAQED